MGSRRVTLLSRGYSTGRLDFKYPHPYSRLRESYILNEIEREEYQKLLALRAQVDAALLGTIASRSKDAFDIPYRTVESYSQLALPYHFKKDKMIEKAGIEDKDTWVKMLAERKKVLTAEKEAREAAEKAKK